MTRKLVNHALSVIFVALILFGPATAAAQESPPPLAEMWILVPKADHGDELRAALAEHMAFRDEHGDPRSWQTYVPLLGDELDRLAIRFCCFNWADADAYRTWSMDSKAVGEHFDATVGPHIEMAEHYFESMDWPNSHWSESQGPYRLFVVREFAIKAGHSAEFSAAVDKMSQIALEQGWASDSRSWLWATRIGGSPQVSIVIPHRDFAGMEQPADSFFRFLADKLGSEEAAAAVFQQFEGATTGSDFQIWQHREDLSMAEGD